MKKNKTILKITVALWILVIISGCWDNKDINHRLLPVVMGVTNNSGIYKVFLQIPEPSNNTTKVQVVSDTGMTITHAVDKINANIEEDIDLSHVKIIIFDKQYAEAGMKETITDFMRATEVSPKTLVVICDEDMDQFFEKFHENAGPEGTTLYDFFEKNAGWTPDIALTRIWEVYRGVHSYTRDVAIPIIRTGKTTAIDYVGSGVVKFGTMIDRLTPDETLLLNAFNGQSAQGKIQVMDHGSVVIIDNSIKNKGKMINGVPHLTSHLKLKVSLVETKKDPTSKMIEQELEKLIRKRFYVMFEKVQAKKTDILGIGQYFRGKITRDELRNWRTDYYPRLSVDFKIDAKVENSGFLVPND
jgi:spore germination protein KC